MWLGVSYGVLVENHVVGGKLWSTCGESCGWG